MDDQTIPGSAPLKANEGSGQDQGGGTKAGREEQVKVDGGSGSVETPVPPKAGREKKLEAVPEL